MESPATWDLLTASLAVSNLNEPLSSWAFLVREGLVRDEPGDREAFVEFAQHEMAHPITGPSAASRVARRLREAGIPQPGSDDPDPWAKIAKERLGR